MSTGGGGSGREGMSGEELSDPAGGSRLAVRAYFHVGVMVILGSTTAAAARYIVRDLPPVWVPVVRFGVAGLFLLPFLADRSGLLRILRRDWPLLIAAAAMCVPVNQGFFLNAARLGPTSHVGLFYATCPLVVLLLAWVMRLESPDLGRLWGVLASVAGVGIIGIGSAMQAGGLPHETRATMLADLLLIGAVLSWGGYLAASKPLIMRHGSIPVLAATFLVGALLDLPLALATSPAIPPLADVAPSAWIALAVLTLFITPVNLACQNLAMRRLDASQVANFSNISPVLTVGWGAWLFGEAVTASLLVGGTLTLAGVLWTARSRPRPRSRPEAVPAAGPDPIRIAVDRQPHDRAPRVSRTQSAPSTSPASG